ncbi:MAG: glyoxalase [Candidatus Lokiarchaeota archaeon]|nr:glyoxalase [Candidatus Lokiarchaeota archaeon]
MVKQNPILKNFVIFVEDIPSSRNFYENILKQEVEFDFGRNVSFKGGLSIWLRDYALETIFSGQREKISVGKHNAELYFEFDDLDELFETISEKEVKMIHPIMEHPWGQRGFRFYDPDDHIIEISETIEAVVLRLHNQGLNINEIDKKSMVPEDVIKKTLQKRA